MLSPAEADSLRSVIAKPSNRTLFDLMLYTGLRLSEVRQLAENPAIFDPDRSTLCIRSGKAKASQRTRNVCLSDRGLEAVRAYLEAGAKVPTSPSVWQKNLMGWARAARLAEVAAPEHPSNPWAITVRTTRKSLESWLLVAYPDRAAHVALSQGHTETTSLRHYLNVSFTAAERERIKEEVTGWGATS